MKKTLLMLALCAACLNAGAEPVQYWLNGVSTEGGWKDVNKVMSKDDITGDSSLCWAAASSNVISWWQDQNAQQLAGRGNNIPQGEQDIFNAFNDAFGNAGLDNYVGLRWFMDGAQDVFSEVLYEGEDGEPDYTLGDAFFDPSSTTHGGFYKDIVIDAPSAVLTYTQFVHDEEIPVLVRDVMQLDEFTGYLVSCMKDGYGVSLGLVGSYGDHAITLWGLEVGEDGYLTKMWVTDSDDKAASTAGVDGLIPLELTRVTKSKDTADKGLQQYEAYEIRDLLGEKGGLWYHGSDEYIDSFAALNAHVQFVSRSVPEPCTGTLSLLALAGLCARRRK